MSQSSTQAAVPATCDLCDAHKNDTDGDFRVPPPVFRGFRWPPGLLRHGGHGQVP